jgi:hypothetical protein
LAMMSETAACVLEGVLLLHEELSLVLDVQQYVGMAD